MRSSPSIDARRPGPVLSCRFALKLRDRTVTLRQGTTIVGRDCDADVQLDDALVSRRHAAIHVEGERVSIEDLGSRNGLLVDGALVVRARRLTHGAVIGVGAERLVLLDLARRERASTMRPAPSPHASAEPNAATVTRSSLAALLVRARAALDPVDLPVVRLVATLLAEQLRVATVVEPALLAEALRTHAACAVELARTTRDPEWIDLALRQHAEHGASLHGSVAASLVALAHELRCDPASCRAYLEATSDRGASLTSREIRLATELETLLAALES